MWLKPLVMKIDIIIKSFNRPYYLDRCLYSIQKYFINFDGTIIVVDDGTPWHYLVKIQEKYPKVTIVKSDFYEQKSKEVINKTGKQISKIPINSWLDVVTNVSDNFLLLEDDIWFREAFDSKELDAFSNGNFTMFKMFWLNNQNIIKSRVLRSNNQFVAYLPELLTKNPLFFKLVFNSHKFGISKFFQRLNINSYQNLLPYYSIYSVAGVIYSKDYFLSLWKNHNNLVNEKLQIFNALHYLKHNEGTFIRSQKELLKTSFLSSATNFYKNNQGFSFDMMLFNDLLNEKWFENELEVTQNLESDLCETTISSFLEAKKNPKISNENWIKWKNDFKNQFVVIGCNF